ncbi:hypothetical protein LSH36_405g00039 [Paralvinella palmiformis]|uniref:Fe2OG dioxygenase domain-containing protein n=1 Tax=Paralvinella palmiformis TaxID=53620 RepID=A0AAD9MYF3_9ANNE|nr:hypothetical protein LSH36_405g00039 [Paralvinella palmiformis]
MNQDGGENELCSLSPYIISNIPPIIYYIPNFISEDDELYLLKKIYEAPKPKWTELLNRRLQNWGGIPHEKGMIPDTIPQWLQIYCAMVEKLGIFKNCKPNHILINEYLPGQGIMPHTDGPLYYPTVANITLKSHAVLEWYRPIGGENTSDSSLNTKVPETSLEARNFARILMERRSLLIVREDMYSKYLHGICEIKTDIIDDKVVNLSMCEGRQIGDKLNRDARVSLTIRNVPKVMKNNFLFGRRR